MPRVLHRLLTFAAPLSLGLDIATAVLWVRSYFVLDVLWLRGPGHLNALGGAGPISWQRFGVINSRGGELGLAWWVRYNQPISNQPIGGWVHRTSPNPIPATLAGQTWQGFHYLGWATQETGVSSTAPPITYSHALGAPYWFIATILLAPPSLWARAELRQRRLERSRRQCRCAVCGYDLRATPDRCPECGTPIATKLEATP